MPDVRLLIVEDESIIAKDLTEALERAGYQVLETLATGEDAVACADALRPDLVLMDVALRSEIDGIEAASAIRERFEIPVIYLIAHADEATLQRTKVTEPFGYVLKPFDERELQTAVLMAVHKHRIERELRCSRQWLKTTLRSIGDAVIATDGDGRITFLNPMAEELTGWTLAEAEEKPVDVVFKIVNEETHRPVENPVSQVLRDGKSAGLANHTLLIRKCGRATPIEENAAPIQDERGNVAGVVLIFRDVSERRRTEEALRESDARFRAAVDQAAVGVAFVGHENQTLFVNRGLCEMLGYSETELLAGSFLDVTHPDDVHIDFAHMPRLITGEVDSCRYEKRYLHKNGSVVWGDLTVSAVRDERGEIEYAVGVVVDITERKRTADTLRDSEARLHAILDSTDACVFAKDLRGRYLIANRSFVDLFGWPDADFVLGKTDSELHGPEAAVEYAANDSLVLQAGKPLEFEEKAYLAGNPRTYLMLKFPLRNHAGEVYGICGIATDITERKNSEQERARLLKLEQAARAEAEAAQRRYRELVDGLEAIVWEADAETWKFTFVNQRAEQILGYPVERWLNEEGFWVSVIHPDDRESCVNFCRTACAECRNHDFTYRAIAADGATVWLRDIVYVVKGEDGRPSRLRGVMVDVTETKRLEAELQMRAAQLAEADRRKDEFLATLAHELRNPLAPIRTGLEVMKLVNGEPAKFEQVRCMLERQTQQLVTLVDDLLDVSRITRGKLELRKCRVTLSDVVQSAVEASRPFIDEGGHELMISVPECPVYLDADPHRLAQVLSNLLNNAAKYTSEGGRVWVTAEREAGDAVVSVKDTGIGIPADMLDRIFEMFAQIDHPSEKAHAGLGIGLTLAKSLVEMHGGRIEVRSKGKNCGSEFSVRLPILKETRSEELTPTRFDAAVVAQSPRRVLVVDDNEAAAEMLSIVVRMLGHEVCTASDGQEAVERAAEFLPHVVLMDIGMPRMNGYEAAQRIREQSGGGQIMLVALTGWGQTEDRRRTREAGFDHHLVKPAEPAELQRLLAEAQLKSALTAPGRPATI